MKNDKKSEFAKRRAKAYRKRWLCKCFEETIIVLIITLALFGTFALGVLIAY
ncbi:hypothetical protein [Faecalimonas sp.]